MSDASAPFLIIHGADRRPLPGGEEQRRYLIYVLVDAYLGEGTSQGRELYDCLRTFALGFGERVAVLYPAQGYEDRMRQEILRKKWTDPQRAELEKLPGLLIVPSSSVSAGLLVFDPQWHRSVHIRMDGFFDDRGALDLRRIHELLRAIENWIDQGRDVLYENERRKIEENQRLLFDALRASPGLAGFTIDLKKVFRLFYRT